MNIKYDNINIMKYIVPICGMVTKIDRLDTHNTYIQ